MIHHLYPRAVAGFPWKKKTALLLAAGLLSVAPVAYAQDIALDPGQKIDDPRSGWLPYAFSTDSMSTGAGAAIFTSGNFSQPQFSLFGTGFATTNDSWAVVGAANNYRIPGTERLFLDSYLLLGHFTDSRYYVDLDRNPKDIKAGSNESVEDDFVTGISNDVQFEINLDYTLPWGIAKDDPLTIYHVDRGLLTREVNSLDNWNPLTNGKTTASLKFFGRYQDLEESSQDDLLVAKSNGLELVLEHDNTDFSRNPTRGSRQKLTLTRDFGWFESSNSWTNLELDLAKYFYLGQSDWFRQKALALNFWTSDTPTWNPDDENPQIVTNRPPPYMGSTLGGFDRLRAFPSGRYNDRSAVYYTAELRMIPQTPPLRDYKLLDYFEIDWIQIVPFVEAGRVGPEYNSDLFFDDLKYTGGVDLRLMAFRNVFRIGWATSSEGESQIWAMFAQPFTR